MTPVSGVPAGTSVPWREAFLRNVRWNLVGHLGGKLLNPLFQILIARLLLPEDYGAYAIAVAWLAFFEIGKDWGLSQAIVVRRGGTPEIALQFTMQFITALAFYAITLALSPLAARLFSLPSLHVALPLVGLAAFISAVADPLVTSCLMEQRYRTLAIRQTVIPLVTGATGLLLAHQGHGMLALVVGLLVGQAAGAMALLAGGRAGLAVNFDLRLAARLMPVGKHIVLQRLFGYLVTHADSFIVGKALGPEALGLYRIGNLLAFMVPAATAPQVQQVVFTELCSHPEPERLRAHYNRFANAAGSALLAYAVLVYAAAPSLVPAFLGEQWHAVVPVVQVFAAVVAIGFVTPLNADIAKILGFISSYSYFAAARAAVTVAALAWAAQFSITHVVVTWVTVGLASSLVNDLLFYSKQDIVRVTPARLALTAAGWTWAAFVVVSVT
jgi:O-antigen/teichoic acid export membrane protein